MYSSRVSLTTQLLLERAEPTSYMPYILGNLHVDCLPITGVDLGGQCPPSKIFYLYVTATLYSMHSMMLHKFSICDCLNSLSMIQSETDHLTKSTCFVTVF